MMLPDTTPDFDTVEATAAFVDLAGYSILTEICGDHEAAQLAARLADLAQAALQPGVRLVKTIGDAVMLTADTPTQMLATLTDLAEQVAPLFEAGNRFIPGRPHDRLAQLVADQKPKRVLELCGGTGYAARLLARKSPSTRVDCLDISPEMLAVGCRYLTRAGIGTVALHEGDAAALPFGNDTFDVVMSVFGWHELPTDIRHRAIDEAIRVLRLAGQVIAIDLDPPPTARTIFETYMRLAERPHARDVLGTGLADAFTAHGLAVTTHLPARSWAAPFQIVHAHKRGI